MSSSAARATELTTPERIRSVLSRAGSLTLITEGHRCDLVGLHTVVDRRPSPGPDAVAHNNPMGPLT
jgi:hypothetical protein